MHSDRSWHALHGRLDKSRISTAPPCRPKRFAKWAVLRCDSAHFALQNGPFYKPKRVVLQHTVYQYITRYTQNHLIKGLTAAHAPVPQAHAPRPQPNRAAPHQDDSQRTARRQPVYRLTSVRTLSFCNPYVAFSAKMPSRADKCTTNLPPRPFFSNQKS